VSSSPSAKPALFTPVVDGKTGLAELRTYPQGDGALALVGRNGLLELASLEDPASVNVPDGMTIDWTSFKLEEEAGAAAPLEYVKGEGAWVAFPRGNNKGEWSVKWKDGKSFFFSVGVLCCGGSSLEVPRC
jgi:hypothetical protein